MKKEDYSIIVFRGSRANPLRVKVSRAFAKSMTISAIFLLVLWVGVTVSMLDTIYTQKLLVFDALKENNLTENAAEELHTASNKMLEAMDNAQTAVEFLLTTTSKQQVQLTELEERYESLKALTKGQEDIARVHKEILLDSDPIAQIINYATAFVLGVLSSLVGTFIYYFMTKKERISQEEFKNLNK